jgi:ATP-dependent Clp endopeptidase proteolytic subunit ClpP
MPFIEMAAQRRSPTPPPGMQPPENAKDWFRIENSAEDADETDVYVYDSIGGWFGMFADEFIEALGQVTTSKINLRLNSPGGSVFEGIAIANAIRSHPANVTVYVDSLAASIASVIALAGDRVVMMPQSQFMIHNASGAAYGDATEMTKMADMLDKQSRNIAEAYASHTGRPLAEWQQYMADETWFTAEEAVAVGLADEVMPMRKKEEAPAAAASAPVMNRSWDLSMYRYPGRASAPAPVVTASEKEFAPGGPVITNIAVDLKDEVIVPTNALSAMTSEELINLIRETIRAETAAAVPPADPDENGEAETDADPEDAKKKKKLPAFLQPDEDEEEETEDAAETDDSATEEEAPPANSAPQEKTEETVENTETHDEWAGLVARLTDSPSPSADDAFQSLKEAWL